MTTSGRSQPTVNKGALAVRLLGELFERQIAATDATRASLTYKKLARYTNPTWEQKVRFGQLLERSNKKLAIGTYENALEDLQRQGRKEEGLLVVRRIVALESSPANHLRVAELSADLGEHVMSAQAFLELASLAEASGANADQYYERAYSEPVGCKDRDRLRQEPAGARRSWRGNLHFRAPGERGRDFRRTPRPLLASTTRRRTLRRVGAVDLGDVRAESGPHPSGREPDWEND
jgi:hypothetical protein